MGKRKKSAALTNVSKKDLGTLQAGPRSTSTTLNYASVNTLDPSRLATAFAQADQGFITEQAALYELIEEQDAHIFGELSKRRRAVTGLGWQLHPMDDANQSEIDRTKELSGMLSGISNFEDAQYDITDAIGKGISALEMDWKTGDEWVPKAINREPQRNFQIDRDNCELMYLKNGMPEPLRQWGWIVHEHRAKSGYIEQAALFRVLAWTYAYKAYDVRDLQRFLELYGIPLRLGKYPAGIGKEARNELLRAVRNIGNDGAGVVPSTMAIDFIEAKIGKVQDFLSAIEYWEHKQSKAILGGELDGKTTSEARIMIYDKVRREILLHDVRQIEPTVNRQLVAPIVLLNGMFPKNRMPVFRYDTAEPVDQKAMVALLKECVSMGMEVDASFAHQVLQIPRAAKGVTLLTAAGSLGSAPAANAALVRLATLANAAKGNSQIDIASAYGSQLAALCVPHEEALIQQIAAIVAEAGSFDAAISGMEALTVNNSAWADSVALGLAAANLAGRSDEKY